MQVSTRSFHQHCFTDGEELYNQIGLDFGSVLDDQFLPPGPPKVKTNWPRRLDYWSAVIFNNREFRSAFSPLENRIS